MKNDDLHKIIGIFNTQNLGNLHSTYKSTYLYPYARYMLSFVKCLMSFVLTFIANYIQIKQNKTRVLSLPSGENKYLGSSIRIKKKDRPIVLTSIAFGLHKAF